MQFQSFEFYVDRIDESSESNSPNIHFSSLNNCDILAKLRGFSELI